MTWSSIRIMRGQEAEEAGRRQALEDVTMPLKSRLYRVIEKFLKEGWRNFTFIYKTPSSS